MAEDNGWWRIMQRSDRAKQVKPKRAKRAKQAANNPSQAPLEGKQFQGQYWLRNWVGIGSFLGCRRASYWPPEGWITAKNLRNHKPQRPFFSRLH